MNTTWPLLLDMTKEESIQYLRNLELEAYSHLVSALRAQGPLNSDKRKLLIDTSEVLNISQERYRAEIRRAINDERLNTIAYHVGGQNGSFDEWAQEGRRTVPLLPRMAPQTCFSALADEIADNTSQTNKQLPSPSNTERKRTQNQQPQNVVECNSKGQVPFRIPEAPIKPQDECKKRKLPICTENSSLAQHLLGPAKMSRIQQIYRQRTKAKTKGGQCQVKNKQEEHPAKQYPKYVPSPVLTTNSPKINVLQNISLQPPVVTTSIATTNSAATTTELNDMQNSSKILTNMKHLTLKPLTGDVAAKTIKICTPPPTTTTTITTTTTSATTQIKKSATTPITTATATTITKTVNSGQKLIVVSNAQTFQSNILQRTLSIPFVKNISVKNIEKFKIVTTNSTNLNATTITNTLNTNSSVKHKVVTVRTNPNTANKKVIPLSQIQMLNTKGSSIKVLPLTGKIVGKTTTSSTAPLYIVNPANNKPTISITTITKQPEIETKEETAVAQVEIVPSTNASHINKENTNKSSVLEDILRASGVVNEDYDEKISEFHIVQKSLESELDESINKMKEEHDATIIEVKPESGDETTQDVIQTHEVVLHEEDVINDTILETNSNDINEFK